MQSPRSAAQTTAAADRLAAAAFLFSAVTVLILSGCRAKGRPQLPPPKPLPPELALHLLPPEEALREENLESARVLHRELLLGGDPQSVGREALDRLARTHDPVFSLLLAQVAFVRGLPQECLDRLRAWENRTSAPWKLLEASCLERLEAWVEAAAKYRELRGFPVAEEAFARILPKAAEQLERSIELELEQGNLESAERKLELLRGWRRNHIRTLELELEVARRRGDLVRELGVLRAWSAGFQLPRELEIRMADLELEIGQPSQGLEIYRRLHRQDPLDPELVAALPWAELRWRLANAPQPVRVLLSQSKWTRADLARFLYWAFPSVRSEVARSGRIAVDILDHPAREEIVRVLNLDLMSVDPLLRTFEPTRPAKRIDLLRALIEIVRRMGGKPCRPVSFGGGEGDPCRIALYCGWIPSLEACEPQEPLGASRASAILVRALATFETP